MNNIKQGETKMITELNEFCTVTFTAEDLMELPQCKDWTVDQCEEWLEENEEYISSRLIELGLVIIEDSIAIEFGEDDIDYE
tara:strand:+ start:492 stop:737 length:246 start_codon:yes stop_codon:yes gene_type:complete